MAYKPKDQFFPAIVEGNVRTTGSSLTLGVGELAFVDISKTTASGVKILNDFTSANVTPTSKLAIRMGEPKDNVSRSEDNKPISTIPFKLKDVTNIYVSAPERKGVLVDDFVIGFNGEDGSEIDLDPSDNEVIEVTLKGDLMGMIGLPDSRHTAVINLTAPVNEVKNTTDAVAPSDEWTMHELMEKAYLELKNYKLPGNVPITNYVDIMLVNSENSATLPGTSVTTYELKVKDDGSYAALGAVQAQYPDLDIKRMTSDGLSTTYSAVSNALPSDYAPIAGGHIKGCEDCPDDTTLVADADLPDICKEGALDTVTWVEGETCNFDVENYTITLADNECGESRLVELQEAYSNLTIVEVSADNCQRVYSTTVNTNLICEECSEIFREVFTSEGPGIYDNVSWVKEEKTYSGTAKMGIRVRGKRSSLSANELLRDDMLFIDDSVEISLVGGFPTYTNESYSSGSDERFTVKIFSRKAKAHNLGGNLRKFEEEAQMHFRGKGRYVGNNYGKLVNGQETRLKGLQNYIVYSVTIAPHKYESNFQQPQNGAFTYHFPVEVGKQEPVENILNLLATATGLDQIQAVAK